MGKRKENKPTSKCLLNLSQKLYNNNFFAGKDRNLTHEDEKKLNNAFRYVYGVEGYKNELGSCKQKKEDEREKHWKNIYEIIQKGKSGAGKRYGTIAFIAFHFGFLIDLYNNSISQNNRKNLMWGHKITDKDGKYLQKIVECFDSDVFRENLFEFMYDKCLKIVQSGLLDLNVLKYENKKPLGYGENVIKKLNDFLQEKDEKNIAKGFMWRLLLGLFLSFVQKPSDDKIIEWMGEDIFIDQGRLSAGEEGSRQFSTNSEKELELIDIEENNYIFENDDINIEINAKNDVATIFKKLDEIQISFPLKLEDFKLVKKLTDSLVSIKNTNHDDKIKYVIASYVYIIKSAVEICGKDEWHGLNKRINLSPYFLLYCTDYNYSICKDYHPTLDPFRKEERLSINLHLFDKSQKLLLRPQEDILMDEKTSNTKWWIDRYMQQYISFIVYCGFNLERPDNKLKKYFEQLENQDIKEIISDFFLFFYSNYTVDNMQDFDDINNSLIDSNFYSIDKIKKLFSKSKLNVDKATVLKKEIELDDIVLLKGGGGCFEGFKIVRIIDWTGCCNFLNKFCVVNESSIVSKKLLGKKIGDKVDIKIVNIDDYGTKFCYDNTTKTIEEKIFDYKINKYHEVVVQSIVKKSKYIALELIKCYKDYLEKFIIQGKNSNILTEIIIYFFQLGEVEAYPLRIKQYYPLDGILNREHYTISWEMTCVFDITICYSTKKISINETNFDNAWFMTLETMAICDYIVNGKNSVRP